MCFLKIDQGLLEEIFVKMKKNTKKTPLFITFTKAFCLRVESKSIILKQLLGIRINSNVIKGKQVKDW